MNQIEGVDGRDKPGHDVKRAPITSEIGITPFLSLCPMSRAQRGHGLRSSAGLTFHVKVFNLDSARRRSVAG